MDRFPYGIYFRMPDADTVRIIVVRHHSRRPSFGLRRQSSARASLRRLVDRMTRPPSYASSSAFNHGVTVGV
jgi:hypothetical protein